MSMYFFFVIPMFVLVSGKYTLIHPTFNKTFLLSETVVLFQRYLLRMLVLVKTLLIQVFWSMMLAIGDAECIFFGTD